MRKSTANFEINFRNLTTILFGIGLFLATAQAQTFSVLHYFTGEGDGAFPTGGMYQNGGLYGTASMGGAHGSGNVFKLFQRNGSWLLTPIYAFHGLSDGAFPEAALITGPDGGLYSTVSLGPGGFTACGVVFELRPDARAPSSALSPWTDDNLHIFGLNGSDGCNPYGGVVFDRAGNIYGAVAGYPGYYPGVVYELSPSGSNWIYTILYTFTDNNAGDSLVGDLVFDSAGNLYGVSSEGGAYGFGEVYQLSPSGSGWTESVIYSFGGINDDGLNPQAGLIADNSGHFYGTTSGGGPPNHNGTVFVLTASNGQWLLNYTCSFNGAGTGPYGPLAMDGAGNLYGTTLNHGDYGKGTVFENCGYLHSFSGADGQNPQGSIVVTSNGTLYGTTAQGGPQNDNCSGGCGVAWQITLN